MSDLANLIERIEKATGGDQKLDMEIHERLVGLGQSESFHEWPNGKISLRHYPTFEPPTYPRLPRYTASIDASLALVEKVLPGWNWRTGNQTQDGLAIWLGASTAPTPPLAILAALLRALTSPAPEDKNDG